MKSLFFLIFLIFFNSCAYRLGYQNKEIPGGITSLYVPVFKNDTMEVGPEVSFTNALVKELERSQLSQILPKVKAEGGLLGRILSITKIQEAQEVQTRNSKKTRGMVHLPPGTFVATQYRLRIKIELLLKRNSDQKILWKQWFTNERVFQASRLALKGINNASPNYTLSEEQRVTRELAELMMREAVDRLTENF